MEIRQGRIRSWLDPDWARARSAELASALSDKFGDRPAKLITLTYDPRRLHAGERDDPRSLYRRQSRERHVRRFIERLGELIRDRFNLHGTTNPLRGRWLRKMEWTKADVLHWHILLDWGPKIPRELIEQAWQHGHIDIRRVQGRGISYVAKYVSKDGSLPSFLLGEPPRSIRIVAVSPGFWERSYPKRERKPSPPRRSEYVPMGELMRRRRNTTECRTSPTDRFVIRRPVAEVISVLVASGVGLTAGGERTWWTVNGDASVLAVLRGGDAAAGPAFSLFKIQDPPPAWWLAEDIGPSTIGRAA